MPEATSARFNIPDIAASFPESASTMLLDTYLTREAAASARVFRVYQPTPAHFHRGCDEFLYVLSGRGTLWLDTPANAAPFAPGQLLFFRRGTVHAMPEILETPVIFLAIDTPSREPGDVIFLNPEEGTPTTFIAQQTPS